MLMHIQIFYIYNQSYTTLLIMTKDRIFSVFFHEILTNRPNVPLLSANASQQSMRDFLGDCCQEVEFLAISPRVA